MSFKVGDKVYVAERDRIVCHKVDFIEGDLMRVSSPFGKRSIARQYASLTANGAWDILMRHLKEDMESAISEYDDAKSMPMPPVVEE